MYRLFVAIDFPEKIRAMLAGLAHGLPAARWVPEDQYHLTLRFIGEVDGDVFRDIADQLATVSTPPFSLVLKGTGCFPPRKKPRVLWIGVEADDTLFQLRKGIDSALLRAGIKPERRRFSPHITIARFRDQVPIGRLSTYLAGNNLFTTPDVQITSFQLYSSFLTPKGAIHQVERSYNLRE